jgi:hypothetical protein
VCVAGACGKGTATTYYDVSNTIPSTRPAKSSAVQCSHT